jgi:hypothetical protein
VLANESRGSQVGGSHDSVVQDFTLMLYFYMKPSFGCDHFPDTEGTLPFVGGGSRSVPSTDRAIDSQLRSVPLPEGLMARLGMLVHTLSNDSADRVDFQGC